MGSSAHTHPPPPELPNPPRDRMFLELVVRHDVYLPAHSAGARMLDCIREAATEAMMQHCSLGYGKVLLVLDVEVPKVHTIVVGRDSHDGALTCPTRCRVVTQQMYVGEVIDVVVTHVSKIGLFATAGAMIAFVAITMMPKSFRFETTPNKLTDDRQNVMPGSVLRVRVKGMRQMSNDQYLIASFNEDFLGVIDAPEADTAAPANTAAPAVTAAVDEKQPRPPDEPAKRQRKEVCTNQSITSFFKV